MSKKALPIILILLTVLAGLILVLTQLKNQSTGIETQQKPENQTGSNDSTNNGSLLTQTKEVPTENTKTTPSVKTIPLTLISPIDGTIVNNPSLVIKGVTVPAANVFVNDTEVTASSDGNFSATITLDEGANIIVITANDQDGNSAEKELTITYTSTK